MSAPTRATTQAATDAAAALMPQHNGFAARCPSLTPLNTLETSPARQVSQQPLVQAKLAVGEPDDEYEREADRVADTVMRMPEPAVQQKPG
jgi:hypothetical protein